MVINEQLNSLRGDHSPMEATFGTHDTRYMTIDPDQTSADQNGTYITSLNETLQTSRTVAHEINSTRAEKQERDTPTIHVNGCKGKDMTIHVLKIVVKNEYQIFDNAYHTT